MDGEDLKFFRVLFTKPRLNQEVIEIPFMATNMYVHGRKRWENIEIEFFDCSTKDSIWLINWYENMYNLITGRIDYPVSYKRNIAITVINPMSGYNLEKWTMLGCQIFNYSTEFNNSFTSNKLTRNVLIEKENNPTVQIIHKIEIVVDKANLGVGNVI